MPWPVWIYVVLVVLAGAWALYDEAQSRRPRYWLAIDLLTTLLWLFFIAAYYRAGLTSSLGRLPVLLFGATLLLTGLSVHREIDELDRNPDPDLSARMNYFAHMTGILLAVAFLTPAVIFGALVARRAWSHS